MTDLTDELISKIVKPGRYPDRGRGSVPGLAFQLSRAGGRSWIFRYKWTRRDRMLGLGRYSAAVGLGEARRRAKKALSDVWGGTDPIAVRREKNVKRTTFGQAAEGFINAHQASWKNPKSPAQWRATLKTYAYPKLEHLAVVDINVSHVLAVLRPIWHSKTVTAKRLQGRIEKVLEYGDHAGDPARWTKLKHKLAAPTKIAKTRPQPALPYERLSEFMEHLAKQEGTAARALEFLIFSASRTTPIVAARHSEYDAQKKLWTSPDRTMKGGLDRDRDHIVPLPARAILLLDTLPTEEGNDFIFVGGKKGRGLSSAAMAQLIKRMNKEAVVEGRPRYVDPKQNNRDIVPHGFRSTFSSWAYATTNFASDVIEMALDHTIRNKVKGAYQRDQLIEKRKPLMEQWSRYCYIPRQAGNVVSLKKAATS